MSSGNILSLAEQCYSRSTQKRSTLSSASVVSVLVCPHPTQTTSSANTTAHHFTRHHGVLDGGKKAVSRVTTTKTSKNRNKDTASCCYTRICIFSFAHIQSTTTPQWSLKGEHTTVSLRSLSLHPEYSALFLPLSHWPSFLSIHFHFHSTLPLLPIGPFICTLSTPFSLFARQFRRSAVFARPLCSFLNRPIHHHHTTTTSSHPLTKLKLVK